MAVNFDKFDKAFNLEDLKNDITSANNDDRTFKEVPLGNYEVEITKLELTESKTHNPMVTCWMKIVEGEYSGSMLFMNQVVTQGFQIHIVNKFLRSLVDGLGIDITFESFTQYAGLLLDVAEAIDSKREFLVAYGENKGFSTFDIKETYDLED